mmetsp:Transcript_32365/g.84525  ORF Transcript_32365/g.84525 Transcript_32365/m.84525 type:complete len:421 (-) Transcript_32365:942-2204(-)
MLNTHSSKCTRSTEQTPPSHAKQHRTDPSPTRLPAACRRSGRRHVGTRHQALAAPSLRLGRRGVVPLRQRVAVDLLPVLRARQRLGVGPVGTRYLEQQARRPQQPVAQLEQHRRVLRHRRLRLRAAAGREVRLQLVEVGADLVERGPQPALRGRRGREDGGAAGAVGGREEGLWLLDEPAREERVGGGGELETERGVDGAGGRQLGRLLQEAAELVVGLGQRRGLDGEVDGEAHRLRDDGLVGAVRVEGGVEQLRRKLVVGAQQGAVRASDGARAVERQLCEVERRRQPAAVGPVVGRLVVVRRRRRLLLLLHLLLRLLHLLRRRRRLLRRVLRDERREDQLRRAQVEHAQQPRDVEARLAQPLDGAARRLGGRARSQRVEQREERLEQRRVRAAERPALERANAPLVLHLERLEPLADA